VPLTEDSVALIQGFLDNGGSVLVLSNPIPMTDFGDKPDPLADYLASEWGIILNNDLVVDTNSPSSPFFAVGAQYGFHAITEKMQGIAAIFPYSRSLTVDLENPSISLTELVLTIDQSWGETDFDSVEQQQLSYDEGVDILGPMTLGVAAENGTTGGRLVVFGSSSFAQDDSFDFSGNGDMFVNTIDWIVEQEDLIGLTESDSTERTLKPISAMQRNLVLLATCCLFPLGILGASAYAWVMRRKRG
jgi:ABC-type uncharacterized transport system involved in gliding motility auxiliary subunit